MHACASARFGALLLPLEANQDQQFNYYQHLNTTQGTSHLVPPHGGELINLILGREQAAETKAAMREKRVGRQFRSGAAGIITEV